MSPSKHFAPDKSVPSDEYGSENRLGDVWERVTIVPTKTNSQASGLPETLS